MVTSGMADAGYKYFNIDDTWPEKHRDAEGNIVASKTKFPSGMPAFSQWIRSHGLKLGLYTAHGKQTCQRYPGSLGYETQDAEMYSRWQVDFLKNVSAASPADNRLDCCGWKPKVCA
eukprot:m.260302 g.260302  ORF g.260302 m.260302 type:complete len:117 (+) comp19214_c0_seq2:4173-4523(+)